MGSDLNPLIMQRCTTDSNLFKQKGFEFQFHLMQPLIMKLLKLLMLVKKYIW